MCDGGWARLGTAVAALLVLTAPLAARASESLCRPWPGEPAPLPTVMAKDTALARWAELRLAELVARAQLAEGSDPLESHLLWRRALCLDPASNLAWRGLDRTRVVRVYRPQVGWGGESAANVADPWDGLAEKIAVARPVPPAPPRRTKSAPPRASAPRRATAPTPPRPDPAAERARAHRAALGRVESALAEGRESLKGARFEAALGSVAEARRALEGASTGADVNDLRARVEVLAATAQVALGDAAAARASFARALAANPALRLDPMRTSPKVIRALEDARTEGGS